MRMKEGGYYQVPTVSKHWFGKQRKGREPAEGIVFQEEDVFGTMTLVSSSMSLTRVCVSGQRAKGVI